MPFDKAVYRQQLVECPEYNIDIDLRYSHGAAKENEVILQNFFGSDAPDSRIRRYSPAFIPDPHSPSEEEFRFGDDEFIEPLNLRRELTDNVPHKLARLQRERQPEAESIKIMFYPNVVLDL